MVSIIKSLKYIGDITVKKADKDNSLSAFIAVFNRKKYVIKVLRKVKFFWLQISIFFR